MNAITPTKPVVQERAQVALDRIVSDADFSFRALALDHDHKANLARIIVNTGRALDPVLLWRPEGAPDVASLIVLDGTHRVAAYRAAGWTATVPAIVLTCDRRTALKAALASNARQTLAMTTAERMDAAWRLVREPVTPRYKVAEIVTASGASARMVKYMRSRFKALAERDEEITGQWWRDGRDREASGDPADRLSDAQRKAEIGGLAKDIRDLLDRRKHPERAILMDSLAVDEAIGIALGEARLRSLSDYLLGTEEDADEWHRLRDAGLATEEEDSDAEPEF